MFGYPIRIAGATNHKNNPRCRISQTHCTSDNQFHNRLDRLCCGNLAINLIENILALFEPCDITPDADDTLRFSPTHRAKEV